MSQPNTAVIVPNEIMARHLKPLFHPETTKFMTVGSPMLGYAFNTIILFESNYSHRDREWIDQVSSLKLLPGGQILFMGDR